jgi:hypothetical protein
VPIYFFVPSVRAPRQDHSNRREERYESYPVYPELMIQYHAKRDGKLLKKGVEFRDSSVSILKLLVAD